MKLEIQLFLFSLLCILNTSADKAIPLITVKQENGEKQFVLNSEALSMIRQLSSPVKVIAAIGDARVGKSTALNFIHYTLSSIGTSKYTSTETSIRVEEIFQTGNTLEPVTHGVWISNINGKRAMDDVILLDVEGTDLGDDLVTDKLSIFTALTSSTLMLFMKESPSTHIIDFLYKIVVLSKKAFGKEESENFPLLTAVLREALDTPDEYTSIDQYIIEALVVPKWEDNSDEKRKAIKTRFPKDHISVFNLPYVPKRARMSSSSEYLESIETLTTKHVLESPEKKSLGGASMDGQALADLAEELVLVMNNEKLWKDLNSDFYYLFEEKLCRKAYEDHIEPLLNIIKNTAEYIKSQKEEKMKLFKERCSLQMWIINAGIDITNAIKNREEFEKQENIMETVKWIISAAAAGVGIAWGGGFLSDVRLKENITLLNDSDYQTIVLRGVEWVWNKQAERLGLSGRGSGVVAQEVELLYPWAVTEGHDGYKRVNYLALRLLILGKKFMNFTLHDEYSRFFANDDLVKKGRMLRGSFHKAINV